VMLVATNTIGQQQKTDCLVMPNPNPDLPERVGSGAAKLIKNP
jgi:hypothetical protein